MVRALSPCVEKKSAQQWVRKSINHMSFSSSSFRGSPSSSLLNVAKARKNLNIEGKFIFTPYGNELTVLMLSYVSMFLA